MYRLVTSSVTSSVPGGTCPRSLIFLTKCVVSLMYDCMFGTRGCKKWSTKADMRSVGQPLAEIIGLPGGGRLCLWILGSI